MSFSDDEQSLYWNENEEKDSESESRWSESEIDNSDTENEDVHDKEECNFRFEKDNYVEGGRDIGPSNDFSDDKVESNKDTKQDIAIDELTYTTP